MVSDLLRRAVITRPEAPSFARLETTPGLIGGTVARGGARRARGRRRRRVGDGRTPRWVLALLVLLVPTAVVVGGRSLLSSEASRIGDYGLIQALDRGYFAGLALLTVGFVIFLWRAVGTAWVGALYLLALTILVDGAPFVIEGAPRFPVTYVHAGFIEAIMRTGETLPLLDARFSWPGFFSLFGYLTEAAGLSDPMRLAVGFPLAIKLLWLSATWVLLRRLVKNPAACWLGLWLFELIDWSSQSYFSPQALGVFAYLVCALVLVVAFDPRVESSDADRVVMAVCILTFAALVMSHQLTPFMILMATGLLGVLRLTRARSLWVLLVVIFAVWFSWGTTDYWVGHLNQLFGDAGKVSKTLNDNVSDRINGNVAHQRVAYARMAVSGVSWALAACGVLVAWRRRTLDGRLVVLGIAPILCLGLQSYGGEGLIRVFLFVLPVASGAGALVFFSVRGRWTRRLSQVALTLLLLMLLPLSMLAKYGGESFESVTPDELATAAWVHQHVEPGDLVASIAPAGLLRSARVGEVDYVPALDDFATGSLRSVRLLMDGHEGHRFLVLTRSQYAYGSLVSGLPEGWQTGLIRDLERSRAFELVYRHGENRVYELKEKSDAPASK